MNKHTAGPWSIPHFAVAKNENDCDCRFVLADGYMGAICSVHIDNGKSVTDGGNDCPPEEEAKANARLIAAAPDLLEALQGFLDMYVRLINNDGSGACDPEYDPHVIAARAAIAKATS